MVAEGLRGKDLAPAGPKLPTAEGMPRGSARTDPNVNAALRPACLTARGLPLVDGSLI